MATPGVDGCWIGPGDLALSSASTPACPTGTTGTNAPSRGCWSMPQHRQDSGFAAFTPQEAKKRAEQGFLFLTAGTDFMFMDEGVRNGVTYLYGERGRKGFLPGTDFSRRS